MNLFWCHSLESMLLVESDNFVLIHELDDNPCHFGLSPRSDFLNEFLHEFGAISKTLELHVDIEVDQFNKPFLVIPEYAASQESGVFLQIVNLFLNCCSSINAVIIRLLSLLLIGINHYHLLVIRMCKVIKQLKASGLQLLGDKRYVLHRKLKLAWVV